MNLQKYKILYLNFFIFVFTSLTFTDIDERFISKAELSQIKIEFQNEIYNSQASELYESRAINHKKSWTIMIYMAADNDLNPFAWKNLKQMELIGSNENINIIVQLNIPGNNTTKRYVVKKGKKLLVQEQNNIQEKFNSGSYHTLINFVAWGAHDFPADNYGLILWNHGTGAIDPHFGRAINPADLFY